MKKEKKNTAEQTAAEQTAQAAEPEQQQETKEAEQAAPQEEQAAPETEPDLQAAAKAAAEQMMEALKTADQALKSAKEAEQKAGQWQDQAMRLQAEFDNFRKRSTAEKQAATEQGESLMIQAILPVIDNLQRAVASVENAEANQMARGVQMCLDQFFDIFGKKGLEKIQAEGAAFDPNFHHAILQEETEDEEKKDTVAQVLQDGYLFKEKVIRYATVKVYC